MRPHVEHGLAGFWMRVRVSIVELDRGVAEEHAAVLDTAVKQVHVAEKIVDEGVGGMW